MGSIRYDGREHDVEDIYAEALMSVVATAQRLGRVEWFPVVDWTDDGRKVVSYLLVAPGVPVSVQVDYRGDHTTALQRLFERYTRD